MDHASASQQQANDALASAVASAAVADTHYGVRLYERMRSRRVL